jgi:hypothetical protein
MYVHAVGRRGSVALRWDGGGELCGAQGRQPQLHGVREHDVSFELVVQPHPHLRHLRLGCWLSNKQNLAACRLLLRCACDDYE